MNNIVEQLTKFANEDKFIQAETELGLFELFSVPLTPEKLTKDIIEIFNSWYLLLRENSHYKLTPLNAALKFQPENFNSNAGIITDIFSPYDDPSLYLSKNTGLTFSTDFKLSPHEAMAGLFIQSGQSVFQTAAVKKIRKIEIDKFSTILEKTDWPAEFYADEFAEMKKTKIDDLIVYEDMLRNSFTALGISDITEVDITDGLEEFEHPESLLLKVKSAAEVFPESASSFFMSIFTSLQDILGVDPEEVKPPGKAVDESRDDETQLALDQMMGQFTDPDQKLFFGDFLDYVKENQVNSEGQTQQQLTQSMGKLEQKWKSTPREKLGGLTPEEFKEKNPHVDKSAVKTVRREEPKIGRNDPCPCGSGKKYKKCCGRNA